MSARTKARKRAVDIVYGAQLRGRDLLDALSDEEFRAVAEPERETSWRYARAIVAGISEHREELFRIIGANAHDWPLERMPVVDLAILLVGAWEIRYHDEVPEAVAIAEAVKLASLLSTEDSAGFVNGVLAALARAHPKTNSA